MNDRVEQLIALRKELHAHPELSGHEADTAARIVAFLEKTNPTGIHAGIGGHGLVAVYDSGAPGPFIGFRCELDALPITENNDFAHASQQQGVSHKCGHDGHMAIVAGMGVEAGTRPLKKGKLALIFQPAEENGYGAQQMLDDPKMDGLVPELLYALHNVPGVAMQKVISKKEVICPASEGLVLDLKGKTSHAGQPDKGNNPAPVMAAIQLKAKALHDRLSVAGHRTKATTVMMQLGSRAFGVNPGEGTIAFTLRSDSNEELEQMKAELLSFAKEKCNSAGLRLEVSSSDPFKAVLNEATAYEQIASAAGRCGIAFEEMKTPFPWSEDFGRFSEVTATGFFGLGAGDTPELHHDTYDFPDELIPVGLAMFRELARALWG